MKNLITIPVCMLLLVACKPDAYEVWNTIKHPKPCKKCKPDTIADNSYIKVRAASDSTYTDEVVVAFLYTANPAYVPGEDAPISNGGNVQLYSLSSDSIQLAINYTPYTTGVRLPLKYLFKESGDHLIGIKDESPNIPPSLHYWLKDAWTGDSTNIRTTNYHFVVTGSRIAVSNRFVIVIR